MYFSVLVPDGLPTPRMCTKMASTDLTRQERRTNSARGEDRCAAVKMSGEARGMAPFPRHLTLSFLLCPLSSPFCQTWLGGTVSSVRVYGLHVWGATRYMTARMRTF